MSHPYGIVSGCACNYCAEQRALEAGRLFIESLPQLQRAIGAWGEVTFGAKQRDILALRKKIHEEVGELDLALVLSDNRPSRDVEDEAADVFIMLCGISYQLGFDLAAAVHRKAAENRTRTWLRPESDTHH